MQESCCQGQHTYLHAQLLLARLGRLSGGARFGRLGQELEAHVAKQHGRIAWQMHFWWAHAPPDRSSHRACYEDSSPAALPGLYATNDPGEASAQALQAQDHGYTQVIAWDAALQLLGRFQT